MKHRILRICGAVLAAIVSVSAATAQTACSVGYTINSQWPGGFGAAITINNTGTTAVSSWTLTWAFANGQTISQLWNGNATQSGANVTVTNESYNGSIPAGGSLTGIGFNATWNNSTNAVPASFALNGVTCTGGSGAPPQGSFSLTASAATLSIAQGAIGTDTISVTDVSPFSGSVTLAASGLPTGVTAAFATNPATGSSVVTFTATSTAVAGASTITITGTSGTLTASATIALTILAAPTGSFSLTPSSTSLSLTDGTSATDTISIADVSPFSGSVTLSVSGLPTGVTAAFATNPATASSVLTLTASSTAAAGTSTVTVTGTSGTLTETTTIALTVKAASTGSFSLTPSSTSVSLTDGASATDTISIVDVGSFSGSVTLSVTGLPTGVTAAFATNPATSSSVLTLTASSTAAAATTSVIVTGTSGSITATATIALTVSTGTSGTFTISAAETSVTVSPNAGATDTFTINDVGGFAGSVTLTPSGLPAGVTAQFSPNPTTTTSVLTFTVSSSAVAGTSTITIQGTASGGSSGNLQVSTTISLTVSATPALQIAWVSPAGGIVGSAVTVLPAGVGASFGSSQGSSEILFGSAPATVTTWTVNSIAVVVPNVPAGVVNVTAVVNGVTSNAVPFTVTAAVPSPVVYTGNSTWFSGLGGPYGGCGVPQANLDSQNFVALNVQNDPGNYSLELSRPISSQFAADIGLFDNGLNCGRWVHITMGANCQGTNDGAQSEPFCRGGVGWVDDQFTGAQLDLVVADSCQDGNAWCRDDPYHLDQVQSALNNYTINGAPAGDIYPNFWNNRQISWYFEPSPNYTGDINIGFLNGANPYWGAISVTHLANGIHGVNYLQNGVWTAAVEDADLGDDYIALPTTAGGTQFEIQVLDITNTAINNGRIYSFTYPSSCGTGCTPALTPVTFTTSNPTTTTTTTATTN